MITSDQLTKVLTDAGVRKDNILIFDEAFILPTSDWIKTKLGPALDKFFFDTGIKYQDGRFDCNKFAKTASTIADWCWAADAKQVAASVAFGIFCYQGGLDGHAINVAVHRDAKNELYLAFYEPEPYVAEGTAQFKLTCLTQKTLDKEDIASCMSCLFV